MLKSRSFESVFLPGSDPSPLTEEVVGLPVSSNHESARPATRIGSEIGLRGPGPSPSERSRTAAGECF